MYCNIEIISIFPAIGQEAQKYIKAGKLVPDDLMIKFINEELKKVSDKSWLLDGMNCYELYIVQILHIICRFSKDIITGRSSMESRKN